MRDVLPVWPTSSTIERAADQQLHAIACAYDQPPSTAAAIAPITAQSAVAITKRSTAPFIA